MSWRARKCAEKVVTSRGLQEGSSDLEARLRLQEYVCVGMCVFVAASALRLSETDSPADADCSFVLQQQVYAQVCFCVIAGPEARKFLP